MEVHHHSHHGKKKWTEYFWEFFMLFLAVTLGFFVENQREHYIEHNREIQYIRSFIEDLKKDTINANRVLQSNFKNYKGIDSLMAAVRDPMAIDHPENIYKYAGYLAEYIPMVPNKRTIQQLKNSGGLRLIRKQIASDVIMEYDGFVQLVEFQGNEVIAQLNRLEDIESMIIDRAILFPVEFDTSLISIPKQKKLFTNDRRHLDTYFNQIFKRKSLGMTYNGLLLELKEMAGKVILLLKREYHLK
jgi:hypothetical protein